MPTPIGRGPSTAEPAGGLTLGEAAVRARVARILAGPTVRDRSRAVVRAHGTGLVAPGG
ncbi:hypothetical protein [Kitasatospora sp. NPDC059327]|uniref:hypothetical protein n=1 Tax=Kitasatospora sp. NPDC059327 TaxID=3346803 RepID=UPI00367B0471